jgi:hypothetical protein
MKRKIFEYNDGGEKPTLFEVSSNANSVIQPINVGAFKNNVLVVGTAQRGGDMKAQIVDVKTGSVLHDQKLGKYISNSTSLVLDTTQTDIATYYIASSEGSIYKLEVNGPGDDLLTASALPNPSKTPDVLVTAGSYISDIDPSIVFINGEDSTLARTTQYQIITGMSAQHKNVIITPYYYSLISIQNGYEDGSNIKLLYPE